MDKKFISSFLDQLTLSDYKSASKLLTKELEKNMKKNQNDVIFVLQTNLCKANLLSLNSETQKGHELLVESFNIFESQSGKIKEQ